jgi:acetyltransferase-like isoleucine patch superfamily enzyme
LKGLSNSSVYDNSYIFGKVSIGKNTWIGPYTILDGSGGKLSIGDFCSISSGVQIYTHNTVNWALTGGKSEYEKKSVRIGDNCYIGPNSIIAMGSTIGKCSIIGSSSFVNSKIPSNSIAFGSPAKIVGKVIVKGKNVEFEYF